MSLKIHGDHLPLTDALNEYVDKKIGRISRYFDSSSLWDAHVTLSVVNGVHRAEVTVSFNSLMFRAEESSTDMYASIDMVADKLQHQIQKYKDKVNQTLHRQGLRKLIVEQAVANLNDQEPSVDIKDVVRKKQFSIKPMDVEEAILQMELLGHDFFVFQNRFSNDMNVLYRRKDGRYGLIEPS